MFLIMFYLWLHSIYVQGGAKSCFFWYFEAWKFIFLKMIPRGNLMRGIDSAHSWTMKILSWFKNWIFEAKMIIFLIFSANHFLEVMRESNCIRFQSIKRFPNDKKMIFLISKSLSRIKLPLESEFLKSSPNQLIFCTRGFSGYGKHKSERIFWFWLREGTPFEVIELFSTYIFSVHRRPLGVPN
jgi:hypothetical protein